MPMNCAGRFDAVASPVIGSVEVLLANTAVLRDNRLGLLSHVGFDLTLLEHGLDDEIAALRDPRSSSSA